MQILLLMHAKVPVQEEDFAMAQVIFVLYNALLVILVMWLAITYVIKFALIQLSTEIL